MNVPKKYMGRVVEIQWMDPNSGGGSLARLKKGREALATWREYGILFDVTDGVVLIAHSIAREPGAVEDDEMERTAIPESLIEKLTLFEVVKEAPSA